jgi:DNA-binding LacI/PurR family transcriptional regulator
MKDAADAPPLYQQIYSDLETKINTGELRFMEQIPALPDLCKIYGVSSAPVRRALDDLARAGLIVKRRGRTKGTVVIKRMTRTRIRVLLLANFDITKSAIETCHEVFDLLAGIQEAAREVGGEVQQVSSNGFESLPPAGADTGYLVIAMTWAEYEQGARLAARHGAPCVLVNPPQAGHACVRVDMEQGACRGVNYLAQLGHRRIAYVGAAHSEWFAPRFAGYRQALAANGLALDPALVQETDGIAPEQDQQALETLMALSDPPTAIFACSDYRALHLLAHCRRKGVQVPQQLSICGYDNIGEVANIEPPLTTVYHPRQELGKIAVELLTCLLAGEKQGIVDRVIRPELVVRASCAIPRR